MGPPEQLEFNLPSPLPNLPELWTPDDIYEHATQKLLLKFNEDNRIDYKSPRIQARELGEYLSCFANTQPHGGIIALGIEKDGEVTGCKGLSTTQLNKIDKIGNYCPDARYELKRIPVKNTKSQNDYIILIRMFYRPDRLVETTKGDAFYRVGDEKRKLLEEQKQEFRISKGEIDYELEAAKLNFPSDFDLTLIQEFTNSFHSARGLERKHDREEILELNNLGKRGRDGFEPNIACALLFAKDPRKIIPGARIRFLRFDGTEEGTGSRFNAVKDSWVDGPVPLQIDKARDLVKSQIRDFTRLGRDNKFYTRPEYPEEAWIEAVVNACAHRSYNLKNMNIFIKMFDDRFVVESPGGFPAPVTPDNIYGMHNPRNPHLMGALFYLDFVKCASEGTRRMRDIMQHAELPAPEFEQKELGAFQVQVTLRNDFEHRKAFVDADVAGLIGKSLFESLKEDERLVLNFIAERGKINVSDANRLLKKDWHGAKMLLLGLVDKQILIRVSKSGKQRDPSAHFKLKT